MAFPFDISASELMEAADRLAVISKELAAARSECDEVMAAYDASSPRMLDFFEGGGGAALGFRMAGINVVAGFEWDKRVCEAARLNLDHEVIRADIGQIDEALARQIAEVCRPDIIHGSPPCQDMSASGKGVLGERANLTIHFAKLVAWMRPLVFSMENVIQLYTTGKPVWNPAKEILRDAGYGLVELKLHAQNHLVPTLRKRAFVIGVRGVSDKTLEGLKLRLSHDQKRVGWAIRHELGDIGCGGLWAHRANVKSPGIIGPNTQYPTLRASQSVKMPKVYKARLRDACPPELARAPTMEEYLKIQSFPVDYRFPEGMKDRKKMHIIGNSVPPNMAFDVGCMLKRIWMAAKGIE